ncbi:hypothetical protein BGZ76_006429, partial [Entomortierella beljakovae]
DQDEDTELPSKKSRTSTDVDDRVHTIEDAVRKARLRKALVDGEADLALLILEERAKVLSYVGNTARNSDYYTISAVARNLRKSKAKIRDMDVISAPPGSKFPVIEKKELYVRDEYKTLHDDLVTRLRDTEDTEENMSNRIIVTGTPGIGKSAFLVYFSIRLLSEYIGDEPPIIIFQSKWGTTCYAFGGDSIVRGTRGVFKNFLDLPETWYLVDSSPVLELSQSRAIFSASPNELEDTLKEVVKQRPLFYHMTPWELSELKELRNAVSKFQSVSPELLVRLYDKIGGIPRYVLEIPALTLGKNRFNGDTKMAESEAYDRVKKAILYVKDSALLLQLFALGKDSLEHSGCILHRWPKDNHRDYYLKWGSPHIMDEIVRQLKERSWSQVLQDLVQGDKDISKGPLFEVYVHHLTRKGGFNFETKGLTPNLPAGSL